MQVEDAKRLKTLEAESAERLLAETMLDAEALRSALRGKF